jgi:hypothetical protein
VHTLRTAFTPDADRVRWAKIIKDKNITTN